MRGGLYSPLESPGETDLCFHHDRANGTGLVLPSPSPELGETWSTRELVTMETMPQRERQEVVSSSLERDCGGERERRWSWDLTLEVLGQGPGCREPC